MRTPSLVISATLISALVLALAVIVLAADPFVGTWKMNPAKSKFSYPAPKSYTITFSAQGNGIKAVQDSVDTDGKAAHESWTVRYDGKDYPITGDPDADTISRTMPNANTTEYVVKKSGKEYYRGRAVVSKDGKTSIDAGSGKDAKGQAFTYSIFMEKQ